MATKQKFNLENSGLFAPVEEKKTEKLSEKTIKTNPVQEGLPANLTRATFIVDVDILETLKDYAYTERVPIKEVVDQALREYVSKIDKQSLLRRPDKQR